MKILMVNDSDPGEVTGGSERYIVDLTRELEDAGHRVSWFVLSSVGGSVSPGSEDPKRRVFAVDQAHWLTWYVRHAFFYAALYRALRAFARLTRPDVIHLHNNYRHPVTLLAATRGFRVVQTVHDYCIVHPTAFCAHAESCAGRSVFLALRHGCMNWKLLLTEGWLLYGRRFLDRRFVARFVAPSRDLSDHLGRRLGSVDVRTLRNFRSLPDIAESPPAGKPTILYAGALVAHKGVDVLVAAYAVLVDTLPDAVLWLVGDGPERGELEALVAEAELDGVRFWGWRTEEELGDLYRRARLVVIPSVWFENAPLVAIEAMAHGRPLVASRVGGLPELVDDGETGLLFSRGDADDLAAKMRLLLTDHALATRMGRAGRRRYAKLGMPKDHVDGLLDIYTPD